jgi:predicted transcriptional regulator
MESKMNGAIPSTRITPRKKGVSAYAKNPFWQPFEVKVGKRHVTIAGGLTTTNEGGQVQHTGIHRVELVDEDKFVKLFTQNLKVFFDLSPASQKVLRCVLETVQENPNADGIALPWFVVEDFSNIHGLKLSRTSFHRALREMLEKGFIAESEMPNFYWINVHLFFNGDRMTFITEYRKNISKQNTNTKQTALTSIKEDPTQQSLI